MPRGAASLSPTSVEWLFDTPIFKTTMTAEMEREANLFRNEFRNESKEDTTMTKTTTKTAKTTAKTTKKETTMPKTNEPKNPQDKILALKASYENAIKQAKTLRKRAKKGDVTNFVTGRPVNRDAQQVAALKVVAAVEGYPTNEWATRSQIAANGGTIKADAFGAPMFMPRGEGKFSYYYVFNKAAVDWKDGKAPTTFVQPTKKKATTSKGKKAAAPSGDMTDAINALIEQNQQLMAALAAALAK